jgi:hypothetical protein
MKLTRYSLISQQVQIDRITGEPSQRDIPGETLLDHFLGDETLYLAQNNDFIDRTQIDNNAPLGTELLLVDRDDLIYGSTAAKEKLRTVLPVDYLAGAYASVFKGGCQRLNPNRPLKVAIVSGDYHSGNANIPVEIARQFINDSCGAIDLGLLQELAGKENAIQFRLGLTGNNPTFGKGMVNSIDLKGLFPAGEAPDLILSADSFKGNKPLPGLYSYQPKDLFLGIKNDSLRTRSSIAELVSIYAESSADILPIIHTEAQSLAANSQDIVTMAAQALNDYHLDASDEADEVREDSFNTAKLIEMALTSGAYNLLNARQVQDWLEDRINSSWKNLSYADIPALNSDNATALPNWDLKYGEVCVPWLPDGEELIFWRSPVVNRNGIITVRNNLQVWDTMQKLGADSQIIYVNVQTLDRIKEEKPATYQRLVTEYGSEERLQNEFQTLISATQMDFDGDTANAISRSRLPHLYDAVKANEHPDLRLANFDKREKNLPSNWTLSQVAEHIRPNYVGVVYSHKKTLELTRAEISMAMGLDDRPLMALLESEYFEKAQKLLFKFQQSDLYGRSIANGEERRVSLPKELERAASKFINSIPESQLLATSGKNGFNFVLGKMVGFSNSLEIFQEPSKTKYFQFTTPNGETGRELSSELIAQIEEFKKLPLKTLWGKSNSPAVLDDYLTSYQQLSESMSREIDLSQPIMVHRQSNTFVRRTNTFTPVPKIDLHYLNAAANPELDLAARLGLYQKVLDVGIGVSSQLNQDAVDVFKSANIIHDENSQVLQRELARDKFSSVTGKTKSRAYKHGNLLDSNGIATPHLIQEVCNQNYQIPFQGKEELNNPDLIRSLREIKVSPTAAAIAQFYLSDDQQIIDRYTQLNARVANNQGAKSYLGFEVDGIKIDVLAADAGVFKDLVKAGKSIEFDFKQQLARVGSNNLGKLDPSSCRDLVIKYPQGLTLDRQKFDALLADGKVDLIALNGDRRVLNAERKLGLNRMRDAFTQANIEPIEALGAIAQSTNRARAGYLIAAYPEVLKEHINSTPVDNLILMGADNLEISCTDFHVNEDGKLQIDGEEFTFLHDSPRTGDYRADNRARDAAHLSPNTCGQGGLVTESYLYSLALSNGKGAIVTNVTKAGSQITNRDDFKGAELKPIQSLAYSINVMGMECPISNASAGLVELWAGVEESSQLNFKEFRYNPLNPKTGKPSFAAIYAGEDGRDYYLEGTIPAADRRGRKIRDDYPNYFVKTDFARMVSPIAPVTLGYHLEQDGVKLGEVTMASAKAAGICHDYTWDITSQDKVSVPQVRSVSPKTQVRLDVPEPSLMSSSAVWNISTPDKVYTSTAKDAFAQTRIAAINKYGSNPLLVTKTQVPTITSERVELKEYYQLAVPARDVAAMRDALQGCSYEFYSADINPHPNYRAEYQRGYSVVLVEPGVFGKLQVNERLQSVLNVVGGNSTENNPLPLVSESYTETASPLLPSAFCLLPSKDYQQELQAARVVRPVVGKSLQSLGAWLQDAGRLDVRPEVDIDKLQPLPRAIADIGAEARTRFHARAGVTADGEYAVFYFGAAYLRDRFVSSMGDAPVKVDGAANTRTGKVYAAVVPTVDLQSYMQEHYRHYSCNYDGDGKVINRILSTYGSNNLDRLPARAAMDVAMGFAANKYIGKSLLDTRSRVELYADAYGENGNARTYTGRDVVMVTGNRFNGTTMTRALLDGFFEREYQPLLERAQQAGATVVFGDNNAVDRKTRQYLTSMGYAVLTHPHGYNEAVPSGVAGLRQRELDALAEGISKSAIPSVRIEIEEPAMEEEMELATV